MSCSSDLLHLHLTLAGTRSDCLLVSLTDANGAAASVSSKSAPLCLSGDLVHRLPWDVTCLVIAQQVIVCCGQVDHAQHDVHSCVIELCALQGKGRKRKVQPSEVGQESNPAFRWKQVRQK